MSEEIELFNKETLAATFILGTLFIAIILVDYILVFTFVKETKNKFKFKYNFIIFVNLQSNVFCIDLHFTKLQSINVSQFNNKIILTI